MIYASKESRRTQIAFLILSSAIFNSFSNLLYLDNSRAEISACKPNVKLFHLLGSSSPNVNSSLERQAWQIFSSWFALIHSQNVNWITTAQINPRHEKMQISFYINQFHLWNNSMFLERICVFFLFYSVHVSLFVYLFSFICIYLFQKC